MRTTFEKTTLPNGLRVISERMPALHSVSVGFWVEAGSRYESPSLGGISHFLEHMLFRGTETRSAQDIAREIDSVGGVLNAFTDREFSCYYAKVLGDKLPQAIDILSDLLLHSRLDPVDIEKERRVILQELHMVEDSPDDLIHDLHSESIWRGHPLGQSVIGRQKTVHSIGRDELLTLLSDNYCGRNLIVCAAGDVDHQDLVSRVEKAFHDLPAGSHVTRELAPDYRSELSIVSKDLEQVHLCLGCRGVSQVETDRYAMNLLNSVLGAGMSSRLFQTIREQHGLAYSIYSYLNNHSDAGALTVYCGTAAEDVPQLLSMTLKELRTLKNELISDDQLERTKEQLKGGLLLSLESTDNRMSRLAKSEIFLGKHYDLSALIEKIDMVTKDDMLQLASRLFTDENLNLQMIGSLDPAAYPADCLTLS